MSRTKDEIIRMMPAETVRRSSYIFSPTHPPTYPTPSVTRLGDLLDFGQLFNAFSNN